MNKKLLAVFMASLLFSLIFLTSSPVSAQAMLTNNDVIEMQKAGMSESVILAKVNNTAADFDTSTAALRALKTAGVSENVILAIVNKNTSMLTGPPSAPPAGTTTAAASAVVSSGGSNVALKDGTEIKLRTESEINGNKVAEGDALTFRVSDDVKVDGRTVIAKDAIAKGVVTAASKNGMMGKGGTLSIRVDSVETVDGQKLKLRSSKSGEGGNSTGSTVALTVLFGPIGLLKHGKAAKINSGTGITTYADENKTILAKE